MEAAVVRASGCNGGTAGARMGAGVCVCVRARVLITLEPRSGKLGASSPRQGRAGSPASPEGQRAPGETRSRPGES